MARIDLRATIWASLLPASAQSASARCFQTEWRIDMLKDQRHLEASQAEFGHWWQQQPAIPAISAQHDRQRYVKVRVWRDAAGSAAAIGRTGTW